MSTTYDINFTVISGNGKGTKTSDVKTKIPKEENGERSPITVGKIVSTVKNPVASIARNVAKVGAVLVAAKAVKDSVTYASDISAEINGDYVGSMKWNNFITQVGRLMSPLRTIAEDVKTKISDDKNNRAIAYNRELYGSDRVKKGV